MAFGSIKLVPGIDTERTPTQVEAGYVDSNLIRWRAGLAQKIGGWTLYYPFNVSGTPRNLHAWQDLNANQYLAVGTTSLLGAISGNNLTTLTPQTLTSDFAPDFSTTSSSTTITVDDPNIANVTTFDSIYFNTPVSVGGLILSGLYPISLVLGTTTYEFEAASAATATVTNGGAVPVFDTLSGSANVTVTLADHGLAVGETFTASLSTTVGGVTIFGLYTVLEVLSADEFKIAVSSTASSTTTASMNSGDAELLYHIALGPIASSTGYGIGTYGSGGYGTGVSVSAQTGDPITTTDWSFDNWGEILLSCPDGGGIYYWQPNTGFSTARLIDGAPIFNTGMLISSPAQIVMAFGSTVTNGIGVSQDPLLIRWCDQENYNDWVDSTTNQAGSFRVPTGSKIVGALQAPHQTLFWTDIGLWSATYIGFPLVYSFQPIGSSCGLIGKRARVVFRDSVYWMGRSNFFAYTGQGVRVMPCTVWDAVFQDLNTTYESKCFAWANTPFDEVWFFYPSLSNSATECDKYAKFNVVEGSWDIGDLQRSCGIDQSLLGNPIAAASTGAIYEHEEGQDAVNQPIAWSFRTGYARLGDGEDRVIVDKIYPDGRFGLYNGAQTAQVMITIFVADYPSSTPTSYGPYTYTNTSTQIDVRFRGSYVAFEFSGDDVGSFYRIGQVKYRFGIDGRR